MLLHPTLPQADLDVDLTSLSAAAEPFLARLTVPDQRVQAAPDSRTIRFYQTSGLLDRPNRYDGRTARYGRRHLLQLVAIRVLQSRGLSLSQVQTSLAGATNLELQQLVTDAVGGAKVETSVARVGPHHTVHDNGAPYPTIPLRPSSPAPAAALGLIAVELAPGIVVTIDSRIHANTDRTLEVLRRALARATESNHNAPTGDLP